MPQVVVYMKVNLLNKDFRSTKNKRFKMRHAPYSNRYSLSLPLPPVLCGFETQKTQPIENQCDKCEYLAIKGVSFTFVVCLSGKRRTKAEV
jgi:hypothetical protein